MSQGANIAIIGTGISGLTCGYLLSPHFQVKVFEANDYIGGHTATKSVQVHNQQFNIDTGFIVFNDWTYPNFIKLMDKLGVPCQPTEMSFSVHNEMTGLEYNGHDLNSLFAQRRNLVSISFYKLVSEILRFNKRCKAVLSDNTANTTETLIEFLQRHNFSDQFAKNYILPMCAAIWSASLDTAGKFPLQFFLKFFNNHGLLNISDRPQWYTITGGSNQYIGPLTKGFASAIQLSTAVTKVSKTDRGYEVTSNKGSERFDHIIFACHSDQALAMLDGSSLPASLYDKIDDVLSAIPYANNEVVLHTDTSVLPKRKLAWASWNYRIRGGDAEQTKPATVSYNMNILQQLDASETFIVTLNDTKSINPETILGTYHYAHPQFSNAMVTAQGRRHEICGQQQLHFCGAYWYNGFHEDGVRSALDVCERFGVSL